MDKTADAERVESSVHHRKNHVEWNQFGLTFNPTKSNGNGASNYKEETKELFEHEQEVKNYLIP